MANKKTKQEYLDLGFSKVIGTDAFSTEAFNRWFDWVPDTFTEEERDKYGFVSWLRQYRHTIDEVDTLPVPENTPIIATQNNTKRSN